MKAVIPGAHQPVCLSTSLPACQKDICQVSLSWEGRLPTREGGATALPRSARCDNQYVPFDHSIQKGREGGGRAEGRYVVVMAA